MVYGPVTGELYRSIPLSDYRIAWMPALLEKSYAGELAPRDESL
jgi:hypothetical protein